MQPFVIGLVLSPFFLLDVLVRNETLSMDEALYP
jgi:hypothetical protein